MKLHDIGFVEIKQFMCQSEKKDEVIGKITVSNLGVFLVP
jgi:hypothetical protein